MAARVCRTGRARDWERRAALFGESGDGDARRVRRPPPLLIYAQRLAPSNRSRCAARRRVPGLGSNIARDAARNRARPARFGSARSSAPPGVTSRGNRRQRGLDIGPRVEDVGGQDEVERSALDQRVAVLGPVDVGDLALDLVDAPARGRRTRRRRSRRRWRARCAPARAATTLGSASPQPSSSTFVPGAGGWSLRCPASPTPRRPRPRPVRDRTAGAALLVAQLLPVGRADVVGVADAADADVQQRGRELGQVAHRAAPRAVPPATCRARCSGSPARGHYTS